MYRRLYWQNACIVVSTDAVFPSNKMVINYYRHMFHKTIWMMAGNESITIVAMWESIPIVATNSITIVHSYITINYVGIHNYSGYN